MVCCVDFGHCYGAWEDRTEDGGGSFGLGSRFVVGFIVAVAAERSSEFGLRSGAGRFREGNLSNTNVEVWKC